MNRKHAFTDRLVLNRSIYNVLKLFSKINIAIITLFVLCVIIPIDNSLFAQAITPTITINLDKTPDEFKPYWAGADRALVRYLTTPRWHENPFEYNVPLNIGIYIDQVNDSPIDRTYKTFLLVSNGAETQYTDKRWVFPIPDWKSISRGSYHPMLAAIEFYTMLVLAEEFDKWDIYGGEIWLTRARAVSDQGKFDTRYVSGWNERCDLLSQIASPANKPYRLFRYYAYTGEYLSVNNPREAKLFIDSAFVLLPKLKLDDRQQFLTASGKLLADAAFRMQNVQQLETLAAMDSVTAVICRVKLDSLKK